jgi:RND family efflux transporter MFP subunit
VRLQVITTVKSMCHHRAVAFVVLVLGAALGGCQGQPQPPAMQPPVVTVTRPVRTPVRAYLEYNGHLETMETVEVRPRVKGLLSKIHFTDGTEVAKGDLLYDIDPHELETAEKKAKAELEKAEADVLNWKAQIKLAEAELERATLSSKTGVGAKTDFDKATAQLDVNIAEKNAAEASRDAAKAALRTAGLQLSYTRILAEISGRISMTRVTRGNLIGVTEPTLLTTIVRMDELYVYFDAPEGDLVDYQRAMENSQIPDPTSRKLEVEVGITNEDGFRHKGKIDFRENRVDMATGTVRIRGRIPNPLGPTGVRTLYPGLYARVRVPTGLPKLLLALPEDCIMTGQEGRYVYIVKDDNTVKQQLVTLGPPVWKAPQAVPGVVHDGWVMNHKPPPNDGQLVSTRRRVQSMVSIVSEIDGLSDSDRVIVDGAQKARPKQVVVPQEWTLQAPE